MENLNNMEQKQYNTYSEANDTNPRMKKCKICGRDIAANAKICPGCGAKNKKPIYKRWWFWAIIILIFIGASNSDNEQNNDNITTEQVINNDGSNNSAATDSYSENNFNIEDYKKSCSVYKYEDICRTPSAYEGKNARFTGKVIQAQDNNKSAIYRISTRETEYLGYTEDIIYVEYKKSSPDEARVLEGDIVTLYGQLGGLKSYKAVLGNQIQIPLVKATVIDVRGHQD